MSRVMEHEGPKVSRLERLRLSFSVDDNYINQSIDKGSCERKDKWLFWRLLGPAADAFYAAGGIQSRVHAILMRNQERFQKPDMFEIDAYMVGRSIDKVMPTVALIADDLEERRTAYRLISRREFLRNAGFCLMHIKQPKPFKNFAILSKGVGRNWEVLTTKEALPMIPGLPIIFRSKLLQSVFEDSHAALGGLIQIGDNLFGLTVSHAVLNWESSIDSNSTKDRVHPEDSEALSDAWGEEDEQEFLDAEIVCDGKEFALSEDLEPEQGYATVGGPELEFQSEYAGSELRISDRLLISDSRLDWALVPILSPFPLSQRSHSWNVVEINGESSLLNEFTSTSVPKTIVALRRGESIPGRLDPYPVLVKSEPLLDFHKMYRAKFDRYFDRGDSGCWIASATTNEWFGVLVGGMEGTQITYIIPSWDILEDIRMNYEGVAVQLPRQKAELNEALSVPLERVEEGSTAVHDRLTDTSEEPEFSSTISQPFQQRTSKSFFHWQCHMCSMDGMLCDLYVACRTCEHERCDMCLVYKFQG